MLEIADIIGIIAFSISGFIIGVRNNLDLLGIILSSFFTALGVVLLEIYSQIGKFLLLIILLQAVLFY
jgi:uncharacterized membrane protein YeiH